MRLGIWSLKKKSFGIWSFFKIVFSLKNKALGILSSINSRIKDELAEKTTVLRAVLSAFAVHTANAEQRHKESKALYKQSFCNTA